MKNKVIFFATNNYHKFNEARGVLAHHKIVVGMLRVKALEIQSDRLINIAKASARDAFNRCNLPLIVEDAGLFIKALNGFPGPYAAYAYKTIGNKGLLQLMKNVEDRRATFKSAIAYYDGYEKPECFEGKVTGRIAVKERLSKSKSGFGFDPIFQPSKSVKTFAEMTLEEKNDFSHRAKALQEFAKWWKNPLQKKK